MAIIEAAGLTRVFKSRKQKVEAVRGVDITVGDGEIVGFLGPNGAGKTTTLRMLTTLLKPTAGRATVAGADLLRDPVGVRRRIGYVPQAIGVTAGGSDPNATVSEELQIQARLYRIPARDAAARTSLLIGHLELSGLERRLAKTLSGGQRRRLDIALGLVHSPGLVFLDEPTTGLDPQSRSNLWGHVRSLRDELGTTVFLTTHYLEEADALCDRVLIIDHGKIIAAGSPDALKRQISADVVTLTVAGQAQAARDLLAGHPAVRDVAVDGRVLRLGVTRGEQALPGPAAHPGRRRAEPGVRAAGPAHAGRRVPDPDRPVAARRLAPRGPGPGRRARTGPGGQLILKEPPAMTFFTDTFLIFRRQMRLSLREPAWVIIGLIQPVLYLVFFGPLLTRVASGGLPGFPPGNSYSFFVPGLLIQLGLFGAAFVGFSIISDWRAGVIERFRVTPVSRLALLSGRVLRDMVTLLVQAIVLVLAGVAFGMRAPVAGVLIGLGFIAVVAVSLSAVSYTLGLLLKSEDALAPLINMVVVPLMLLSGIMLPLTLGPGWLQGIARATPFRYIIDAMRQAFGGVYATTIMVEGVCVAVGLAAVCLWVASRAFVRENA